MQQAAKQLGDGTSTIAEMKILVLNAGSSSQKSCLYELGDSLPTAAPVPLWKAHIDWTHQEGKAEIQVKTAAGTRLETTTSTDSRPDGIAQMLSTLWQGKTQVIEQPSDIHVVGHRVVHGGQEYRESTLITPAVKDAIAQLATFAPSHNPANLEGILAVEQLFGTETPQVAAFDTAFHTQLPLAAAVYPGPYEWFEQGIRRYGFHGISHQYCAQRTAQILGRDLADLRLITCHLGNGCSLAAIRGGVSVDTTMGFTPLEGLMMGSRSGTIDPGILIHLLRHANYSVDQLDQVLNQASGLEGISGISSDMRQIRAAIAAGNPRAQLALDLYIHRLRAHLGAMLLTLGGLDALVFTGGVGENHAPIRSAACTALEFLGLKLDLDQNAKSPPDQDIATADSPIRVLIIQTQEEWAIAQDCWRLSAEC